MKRNNEKKTTKKKTIDSINKSKDNNTQKV